MMRFLRVKMLCVFLAFIMMAFVGCGALVNDEDVRMAVVKQGYTDVQILDKDIFFVSFCGCGQDDEAHYDMVAVNPIGYRVKIDVCAGWPFKGVTVRTR